MSFATNIIMKHFFILLLVGFVLILVQAVPWSPDIQTVKLNLSFVLVVFLALYHPSIGSLLLVFMFGYLLGALSCAPAGLMPLINLTAFFLTRVACKYMLLEGLTSQALLVFTLSLCIEVSLLATTKILSSCPLGLILKNILVHSLLLTALSIPFFAFFNKRVDSLGS